MWNNFSDNWLQTATCIAENVTISYKHEYRWLTLLSRCDVIIDIISMKNIFHAQFAYVLFISDIQLELYWIAKIFTKWRNFEVGANFFVKPVTGEMLY